MFKLFLLLTPLYVTLFWAVLLNLLKRQGNEPKWFLGKFMLVSLLIFISHLFYYLPLPELYIYMDPIYYFAHLSIFPLYYIYVRLLALDIKFSFKQHYKHFLACVIFFIFHIIGFFFVSTEEQMAILYGTIDDKMLSGIALIFKMSLQLANLIFVVQGILYMTLSVLVIKQNNERVAQFYSNSNNSLKRVQWLNISISITMITCIIMEIIDKITFADNYMFLIIPSIILSVMLFWIGFLGIRQQQLVTFGDNAAADDDFDADKRIISGQTETRLSQLKVKIEELFEIERIYLNENLTIYDIAHKLGSNRSYISRVINVDFGMNFSQFVNSYRLSHARDLASREPNLSREDLAVSSGFSGTRSMRRAWKVSQEEKTLKKKCS